MVAATLATLLLLQLLFQQMLPRSAVSEALQLALDVDTLPKHRTNIKRCVQDAKLWIHVSRAFLATSSAEIYPQMQRMPLLWRWMFYLALTPSVTKKLQDFISRAPQDI